MPLHPPAAGRRVHNSPARAARHFDRFPGLSGVRLVHVRPNL